MRFGLRENLVTQGDPSLRLKGGYAQDDATNFFAANKQLIEKMRSSDGKNRGLVIAGALALVAAALALRVFDPATAGFFPPCPVRYLTGWYCPGCGSLRAMHQLLEGNLRAAWAMNPLTVILLPFLSYGLASHVLFEIRGRGLPRVFLPAVWIRALCVAIVLFGIVRNLPLHPFELLAPGGMLRP